MTLKKLKNEQGFIMVMTMLVLVILTILFISSMNQAFVGVDIAANDKSSGESSFAAKGCAQIKSREILALNGNALATQSLSSTTHCNTNQPKIVLYNDKLVGFKLGSPGGWAIQQMSGVSTGRKNSFLSSSVSSQQFIVQRVFKK